MSPSMRNHKYSAGRFHLNDEIGSLFEHLPLGILVEDCSVFAELAKNLEEQKVRDIRHYLIRNPELVISAYSEIRILYANKAALKLYQARNKKELASYFYQSLNKKMTVALVDELMALVKRQKEFEAEFKFKTIKGKLCDVLLSFSMPPGSGKALNRVIVSMQDITRRKRKEEQLRKLSQLDSLTGLLNHHAISRRLEEELVRAKRYGLILSCMMIDIDYFKRINDEYGHQKGDQIIKYAANLIKNCMRKSDIVGRYGGDEFFVILPQTKPQNSRFAALRVQKYFSDCMLKYQRYVPIKNTLSIGISGYPYKHVADSKDLVAQADRAMYKAKASGRDKIILA